MAKASSPTCSPPLLPSTAGTITSGGWSAWSTAMSFSGCSDMTSAVDSVPSMNVTLIDVALAITWRAVRIAPSALTTTPAPSDSVSPVTLPRSDWIVTSEGRIVWYTFAESGGSAWASAIPSSTADFTMLPRSWGEALGEPDRRSKNTTAAPTTATAIAARPTILGHRARLGDAASVVSSSTVAVSARSIQPPSTRQGGTVVLAGRSRRVAPAVDGGTGLAISAVTASAAM